MIIRFVALLIIFASLIAFFGNKRPNSTPNYAQASQLSDQKLQPARQKLMYDMVQRGLFKRITANTNAGSTLVNVVTLPAFRLLDYDAKNTLLSPVFAYYLTEQRRHFNNEYVGVRIYDNMSGEKIGEYDGAALRMTN